ncbi:MAG: response regulator [Anaerolineales bacterium]|nr:response regulator [Anaerolineales bacterium]MBX3038543.1 response regulator [Anaerolineales bacterium]
MLNKKILLAEDDITMVSLLKTLLKMEGFDIVSIHADANVPEEVKKEKPAVLLLDFHLGAQNGIDILDEIRSQEETRDVKVIMSSGASVKEECMNRGANGFLLKPYMPDDLISLLKQTISA